MAEEYDPRDKRMLGNFPQAFSHVGLVDSAFSLSRTAAPYQPAPAEQRARTGQSSDREPAEAD